MDYLILPLIFLYFGVNSFIAFYFWFFKGNDWKWALFYFLFGLPYAFIKRFI